MITFLTIAKAVRFAFPWLAKTAMVLVATTAFASSESLDRFHTALAEKYGYQAFEVKVTPVTNPGHSKIIRKMSEAARGIYCRGSG